MILHISDKDILTTAQVMQRIASALDSKAPFSLIRIGIGENLILSQEAIYSKEQLMALRWAREANKGRKGIKLPNLAMRDHMIDALRHADMVAVLAEKDDKHTRACASHRGALTNRIFAHYGIEPHALCYTNVNRELMNDEPFWEMLRGRRLLLISAWAGSAKRKLVKPPYSLNVAAAINFERNEQMEATLQEAAALNNQFDIALVSCGVITAVLTDRIVQLTGKIGIDFGIGLQMVSMNR